MKPRHPSFSHVPFTFSGPANYHAELHAALSHATANQLSVPLLSVRDDASPVLAPTPPLPAPADSTTQQQQQHPPPPSHLCTLADRLTLAFNDQLHDADPSSAFHPSAATAKQLRSMKLRSGKAAATTLMRLLQLEQPQLQGLINQQRPSLLTAPHASSISAALTLEAVLLAKREGLQRPPVPGLTSLRLCPRPSAAGSRSTSSHARQQVIGERACVCERVCEHVLAAAVLMSCLQAAMHSTPNAFSC